MTNRSFHSKILLFGEYSIIMQSQALAMPYSLFEGRLAFKGQGSHIDAELKSFVQHAKKIAQSPQGPYELDATSLEFDVGQGLYFESTIPQGFGVGSSGALCAALFDRYVSDTRIKGKNKQDQEARKNPKLLDRQEVLLLKNFFSQMESHFHGTSSGIDPLISYLDQSLLIRGADDLGAVTLPQYASGEGALFLLNTARTRRTEPLVNLFLEKCKNDSFKALCQETLIPLTHRCITHFLEGQTKQLWENFKQLSLFQYQHFNPMIPKLFDDLWAQGHNEGLYSLKLCGAGGGGFLLGMAYDFKAALPAFKGQEVRPLLYF